MSEDDTALTTFGAATGGAAVALLIAVAVLGVGGILPATGDASPAPTEEPPHSTPLHMNNTCNETNLHVLPAETKQSAPSTDHSRTNDSDANSASRTIDSPRDVERQLLAEFDVGTCSGMPTVITEDDMATSILNHSQLTAYIVVHHNVTSQERIYEYIQQYKNIHVENVSAETYEFRIRDGECCAVTTISGTYNATTDVITITNKTTEHMPC